MVLSKLAIYIQKSKTRLLSPCTKINSKWIKDLNIRPETLKLILKKIEKTIGDIGIGNCFLNMIPIVQETGYPCVED
jgi:hypothetical protein